MAMQEILPLSFVQADLLVIEIVDDDWFSGLAMAVRKIVSKIGKSFSEQICFTWASRACQ